MKHSFATPFLCILSAALLLSGCGNSSYRDGVERLENKEYAEAAQYFAACEGYKDADKLLYECTYLLGVQSLETGDLETAKSCFQAVIGSEYTSSAEDFILQIEKSETYASALQAIDSHDYENAYQLLSSLGDFENSQQILQNFTVTSERINETLTETDYLNRSICYKTTYFYDDYGRLSRVSCADGYTLPHFSAQIHSWDYAPLMRSYATDEYYSYNDSGRLISITGKNNQTNVYQIDFEYGDGGRVSAEHLSGSAQLSRPEDITRYHYDETGVLSFLSFDSAPYNRVTYSYNDDGTVSGLTIQHLMFPATVSYIYENGLLAQCNISRAKTGEGIQPYRSDIYSYNADGSILSVSSFYSDEENDIQSAVTEFTYGPVYAYKASD